MATEDAADDDREANRWSDWEDEDESPIKCLFSDHMCENVEEVISRAKEDFGFDLLHVCEELNLLVRCGRVYSYALLERACAVADERVHSLIACIYVSSYESVSKRICTCRQAHVCIMQMFILQSESESDDGFIGCVRLVNFLRRSYATDKAPAESLAALKKGKDALHDDALLKPHLQDDQLLYNLHNYLMQQRTKHDISATACATGDGLRWCFSFF